MGFSGPVLLSYSAGKADVFHSKDSDSPLGWRVTKVLSSIKTDIGLRPTRWNFNVQPDGNGHNAGEVRLGPELSTNVSDQELKRLAGLGATVTLTVSFNNKGSGELIVTLSP